MGKILNPKPYITYYQYYSIGGGLFCHLLLKTPQTQWIIMGIGERGNTVCIVPTSKEKTNNFFHCRNLMSND